mmetsp:Transcript_7689/g.16804  ORF Transcript_7689/g.16804 Transcript_7689/m.16804 type:complete len:301 (-) Transcript_7689:683-1585(-)
MSQPQLLLRQSLRGTGAGTARRTRTRRRRSRAKFLLLARRRTPTPAIICLLGLAWPNPNPGLALGLGRWGLHVCRTTHAHATHTPAHALLVLVILRHTAKLHTGHVRFAVEHVVPHGQGCVPLIDADRHAVAPEQRQRARVELRPDRLAVLEDGGRVEVEGARVVAHQRQVTLQLLEVAVVCASQLYADLLQSDGMRHQLVVVGVQGLGGLVHKQRSQKRPVISLDLLQIVDERDEVPEYRTRQLIHLLRLLGLRLLRGYVLLLLYEALELLLRHVVVVGHLLPVAHDLTRHLVPVLLLL